MTFSTDRPPRLLIIEDGHRDTASVVGHVASHCPSSIAHETINSAGLADALVDASWDVVLADYGDAAPGFDAALETLTASLPHTPIILVVDQMDDARTHALMERGVWDVLLRADLHRLCHLVMHALRDVEHRRGMRAAEAAQQQSEERYRQVFLHASDAMFVFPVGLDGTPAPFTSVNQAAAEMLGYTIEELLQCAPPALVAPEQRASLSSTFEQLLSDKRQHVELVFVGKSGRRIPVEISGTLFEIASQPTVLGIVTDITGKKRAADLYRQHTDAAIRRHRLHARIDLAIIAALCPLVFLISSYFSLVQRVGSWVLQHDTLDDVVAVVMFGACAAFVFAFRRKRDLKLEAAERGRVEETLRALQGELESRVQRRTAQLTRSNSALRAEVAERERAEATLRLQGAALDASADAIVITDHDGRIAWLNQAFTSLTGYASAEAVGRKPGELIKSGVQDAGFYKDLWSTILGGRAWRGELMNRRKDGSVYSEHMTITPVANADGATTHFVAIKRDVSEEKRLKAQFLQAQKMESVGRLAGGIAHDFNNLLTVINGTAELAAADLKEDDPLRDDLYEIHHAGERAAALTRQLLAFSRKQIMKPQVLELGSLVENVRSLLQRVIGEDIRLVVRVTNKGGVVMADPGQIEQVLMNLVVNARDAMPTGGTVTIRISNLDVRAGDTGSYESLDAGSYVALSVADTGVGMNEETRAHLFEPFFTTKDAGKGTGLGLATVYGIVQQSGGQIRVDSEPGRGATFSIYLPRVTDAAAQVVASINSRPAATGAETILVVEDESSVREMVRRMLAAAGYNVLSAANATEALVALDRYSGSIDLLLTDVVMPGTSGPELAARVAPMRPRMKVLFTSGHTENAAIHLDARDARNSFIGKPYTRAELLQKVRDILELPDGTAAADTLDSVMAADLSPKGRL